MKIQISKLWFIILETVLTIVLLVFTYGHVFLGKDCTAIINTILGVIFAIYTLYCSKSTIDGVSKAKNGDCNAIVAIGDSGKETGIYTYIDGEKPLRRFKFNLNVQEFSHI